MAEIKVSELKDFDIFFYYGMNDLEIETKSDIYQNLLQPERSLLYNRSQDSAGIQKFENTPNTFQLQILLPYSIITSLAKRNSIVSAGQNGDIDRRVAVSQSTIRIEQEKEQASVILSYIPLANLQVIDQTSIITIAVGV